MPENYPAHHDIHAFPDDEKSPRVLYVGNLPPTVDEELLMTIFSKVGSVIRCKMIPDGPMKYAFVEFTDNSQAAAVKSFMHERDIHGSKIRINWKTQPKKDTTDHFHIFIGDLSPEVTSDDLYKLFGKCGEVSDARVIKDTITQRSKGYGFVSFVEKSEAERAKDTLNGMMVGSRAIRINWASRKPEQTGLGPLSGVDDGRIDKKTRAQTYAMISKQSPESNTTVYLGNITPEISEHALRDAFDGYGPINTINMFPQKGYAFIVYADHEGATKAIAHGNGIKIGSNRIKANWGREPGAGRSNNGSAEYPNYGYGEDRSFDEDAAAAASSSGYGYGYGGSGYGGGYGYGDPAYANYYPPGGYGYAPPSGPPPPSQYGGPPPAYPPYPADGGYSQPPPQGAYPPYDSSYAPPAAAPGYGAPPPSGGYPPYSTGYPAAPGSGVPPPPKPDSDSKR